MSKTIVYISVREGDEQLVIDGPMSLLTQLFTTFSNSQLQRRGLLPEDTPANKPPVHTQSEKD